METAVFIDTSVLCNLVPVPRRDQQREAVKREIAVRLQRRPSEKFLLPITAVIETGNYIAQLANGSIRGEEASRLVEILRMVIDESAPWVVNDVTWVGIFADFPGRRVDGSGIHRAC